MAKTDTPQTTHSVNSADVASADDDDKLRKRLLSRIAVAGVVIAGLLGGLAVFDSLNKPPAPALPKMAAAPAESAEEAKEAKPAVEEKSAEDKSAETKPGDAPGAAGKESIAETKPGEEKAAKENTAKIEAPVVPERTDTPLALPPPGKSLPAERLAKPVTPPASARPAAVKPSPPVAAPVKPDAQREIARAVPEGTGKTAAPIERHVAAAHAPASRPLTQAAEAAKRFLLQVGVFSNHANAEELVARLQQAGVPAQIESRVQVGPFASRQEADVARAKLKSLGIDDGLLVRR